MSATFPLDAPPALRARAVGGHASDAATRDTACADVAASTATLEDGVLRVRCVDGVEVIRPAAWLREAGDGRDAIDVVLRPCGTAVTVTWRDGRRNRYAVATLRA